ncbi:DNA polymerase III subunit alpha [Pelomicrobium sp.]|uniref:DNA polymerase III subunit alpha n=1 Tax=Pelomicrobium sp. TaxID=2815319 RepID=UPI002FDD5D10
MHAFVTPMPDPVFIHLRLHSEYSIVDGIVRIEDAVRRAREDRMPALALTDLANVFGMVKFYEAARSQGVKPLIGCDLWLTNETDRPNAHRLLLLCQSRDGYLRLSRLLTRAYLENQYRGRPEIKKGWFEAEGTEGLILLSGAHQGDVGAALMRGDAGRARALAEEYARLFPARFYLELQRDGTPNAENCTRAAAALAARLGLPVVATHPIQFLAPGDFRAHEARVCIAEGYILSDQRRPKAFTPEQYFKTQAEMRALFADLPEALANSVEIARRCSLEIELGKAKLPRFPTPEGVSLEEYLEREAQAGLERRLARLFPDTQERDRVAPRYRARLAFEIETIQQMGFSGYFLIVADFINWAKSNGVPVGPGRGSGAGSLVAYCLGITDLDPIRYDLLFERFLNPERVSMPDFDIDFCQDGRDRVIEYVRQKYGHESVSQIATFGTMAARAGVRDVGRVLDLGYNFCDQLAKLIPFQPGKHITLAEARQAEPLLAEREKNEEEVQELLALAERLEGLTRNVGMHAGGVLIAPGRLTDFCPLYVAQGSQSVVSQLDKDDVEKIGLVKFDFLGLTTLTILDWTLRYVRQLDPTSCLSLESLPLDDPDTYRIFSSANTTAVFQFESRGMRDLLKRARPDRFEDLIALVALYRPGPMDLIPEFIERKHGRKAVEYLDPRLAPILGPTYGIMVYQEQVMQIAQVIGGYTLGGADLLRRAMGKKKPEEMARHREIFVAGAEKNGLRGDKASQLFDLMEKFAGYGFNKSHAAAYALVAYQTAYMKAHHPAAFMAANLSAVMDDTDKVEQLYEDARQNGLTVLPPDVNESGYRFVPVDERTIRYGLGAVKGTGQAAIDAILAARTEGGPFRSLLDFCRRVDKRVVNRRVVESLVRAGAFDSVNEHRASLLASVGIALEEAERRDLASSQVSLFGAADGAEHPPALIDCPPWSEAERLQNEKLALGFYLSGHPFNAYAREVSAFVKTRLAELQPSQQSVLVAGMIYSLRIQPTRRGRMGVIVLDDGSAKVEVVAFSELFEQHRAWLREEALAVVEAKVVYDEFTGGVRLTAEKLMSLSEARGRYAKAVRLVCNGASDPIKLRELLEPYRHGTCPVVVHYVNGVAECDLPLGDAWRVRLEDELIAGLEAWLARENVQILY